MSIAAARTKSTSNYLASLIAVFLCSACTSVGDVYSPDEWNNLFEEAGGWTPLPIPDSKHIAGSIIQVTDSGVRWIGDLAACGFPTDQFSQSGQIPSISFSKGASFGADALLTYQGVTAGPEFGRIESVVLEVSDHSADAINLIALQVWREYPDNRESVSDVCFNELAKVDRYLITEAFTVSQATYKLYDQTGAEIELSAPVLGELLDFSVGTRFTTTASGHLSVNQPTVFAIRKAVRVNQSFEILGNESADLVTADGKIEDLYLSRDD